MAKKKESVSVLDVVRGLAQAAANAYDGALDDNGEILEAGLRSEEGDPILDKRIIDGFGVKFHGNKLCINYHGEVSMKDLHRHGPKNFENEIEQMYADIVKFLKKEYKKTTGSALTLSAQGDSDSLIQRMNSVRNWVQSAKWYEIGNITDVKEVEGNDRNLDPHIKTHHDVIKKFLSLSSNKNPKNVTRKPPDRPGLGEVD